MNPNYSYLKTNENTETTIPSYRQLPAANGKIGHTSMTIHVNPLCASNKILVNKEKLSTSMTRNSEKIKSASGAERIHYNPKFLTYDMNLRNASCIKQNMQPDSLKSVDSNIYFKKNYLFKNVDNHSFQKDFTSKKLIDACNHTHSGIHFNPKFFNNSLELKQVPTSNAIQDSRILFETSQSSLAKDGVADVKLTRSISDQINKIQSRSKYKLVKNIKSVDSKSEKVENHPLCFKTKYSLKRLINNSKANKDGEVSKIKSRVSVNNSKLCKISHEFKNISRTKLVRKSVLQSMILARRHIRNNILIKKTLSNITTYKECPLKKKSKNITYFPNEKKQVLGSASIKISNNSFKMLSKTKIVRKSLLKTQIEARNQVKKQYLKDFKLLKFRSKYYISKYKARSDLVQKNVLKQRMLLKWKKKKKKPRTDSSQSKCKTVSSKNLRKISQPCAFYNRFGRCKGKDKGTCLKLHDPKYVSICRKFIQGDCSAKDCLLSHDIRPGKMPTCHHYLAGLCTRPNCPYLHIKVNPKAPICINFLRGFCSDVYNCLKRHEFICPIYAEKGVCPRGKCCTYPHRLPVIHSKLLKDDQKPLIPRSESSMNSSFKTDIKNDVENSSEIKDTPLERPNNRKNKIFVKEPFTRYFAIPSNSEENCDSIDQKLDICEDNVKEDLS